MIEVLFGLVTSGFLSLIFMDIRDMKGQINKIENEVIFIKIRLPKRKTDIDKSPSIADDN